MICAAVNLDNYPKKKAVNIPPFFENLRKKYNYIFDNSANFIEFAIDFTKSVFV